MHFSSEQEVIVNQCLQIKHDTKNTKNITVEDIIKNKSKYMRRGKIANDIISIESTDKENKVTKKICKTSDASEISTSTQPLPSKSSFEKGPKRKLVFFADLEQFTDAESAPLPSPSPVLSSIAIHST